MIVVHPHQPLPHVRRSVVSVGNFDGVHAGHSALVETVVKRARRKKAASIIITFEPHTRAVLNPSVPLHILTTSAEKEILLRRLRPDILVFMPFSASVASLSPEEFINAVLIKRFKAMEWVMGENHAFGRAARGTKDFLLQDKGKKHINVFPVALSVQQTTAISSTRIRSRIVEGRIREAVAMLGHPYLVVAQRTKGTQTGTTLGFPTVNFKLPPARKVIPPPGVYAAILEAGEKTWEGALYIGNCPTFSGRDYHLEFHSLSGGGGFPKSGETASIWIHSFIRKDEPFESADDLVAAIDQDITEIRHFFKKE